MDPTELKADILNKGDKGKESWKEREIAFQLSSLKRVLKRELKGQVIKL